MMQKIAKQWTDYSRLGGLSPHDPRRATITKALESVLVYRQVQMMSKRRDPKTVMRYDDGRENLLTSYSAGTLLTQKQFLQHKTPSVPRRGQAPARVEASGDG